MEVELAQKHPCTNVGKYWPWLVENPSERIVLVQVFFDRTAGLGKSDGLGTSRDKLGQWLAKRMEHELSGRFYYRQLVDFSQATLEELQGLLGNLLRLP